ncbi:MAG: LptF/LptG family permease [Planctomycetes bacterium]|nr:LptF/LptG family permease [Planctomycetota bacterium]
MLWTLQWYIFRELGKTFLLTAIGLTAIIGLGGGVLNIIDLHQVTAGQMLRIMSILLPVATTLALPVAALFSAAVVYGRMGADNEFVACRASGINIHRLFAPTVVISLFSAAATFFSINYVIPDRIRNLDQVVRADLGSIVQHQLQAPGRLPLAGDRYRVYAEDPQTVDDPDLPADSEELVLQRVAFVEMQQGNWVRYGTAEAVRIRFDQLDTDPSVRADFFNLTIFDRSKHSWSTSRHQGIERNRIPRKMRLKVKWLDLGELFHFGRQPDELPEIRDAVARLRAVLVKETFFRDLIEDFKQPDATGQPDGEIVLADGRTRLVLQADLLTPDPHDFKPRLENVRVVETVEGKVRTASAGAAIIDIDSDSNRAYVELVEGVTLSDPANPSERYHRRRERLEAVAIPARILDRVGAIPVERLLAAGQAVGSGRDFLERRAQLLEKRGRLVRQIDGVIHSRLAFSTSVFVLVILAAGLGIILRDSNVLTAFGISFVPSLLVVVTIIMGRQLAQNEGTATPGLLLIWFGIAAVGLVDAWTLTRILRR